MGWSGVLIAVSSILLIVSLMFLIRTWRKLTMTQLAALEDLLEWRVEQEEVLPQAFALAAGHEEEARGLLESKVDRYRQEVKELKARYKTCAGAHILGDGRLSLERRLYLTELYCRFTGKQPVDLQPEPDGDAFVGVRLDPALSLVHKTTLELALVNHLHRVYEGGGGSDGDSAGPAAEEEGLEA